jgi:hypothetical protein
MGTPIIEDEYYPQTFENQAPYFTTAPSREESISELHKRYCKRYHSSATATSACKLRLQPRRLFIVTRPLNQTLSVSKRSISDSSFTSIMTEFLKMIFPTAVSHWGLLVVDTDGKGTLFELTVMDELSNKQDMRSRQIKANYCQQSAWMESQDWKLHRAGDTLLCNEEIFKLSMQGSASRMAEHSVLTATGQDLIRAMGREYTFWSNNCQRLCYQLHQLVRVPLCMEMLIKTTFAAPLGHHDIFTRQYHEYQALPHLNVDMQPTQPPITVIQDLLLLFQIGWFIVSLEAPLLAPLIVWLQIDVARAIHRWYILSTQHGFRRLLHERRSLPGMEDAITSFKWPKKSASMASSMHDELQLALSFRLWISIALIWWNGSVWTCAELTLSEMCSMPPIMYIVCLVATVVLQNYITERPSSMGVCLPF